MQLTSIIIGYLGDRSIIAALRIKNRPRSGNYKSIVCHNSVVICFV